MQPLKCKPKPLTDEEKKAVEESPSIDEILPRETPEDQKKRLDKLVAGLEGEENPDAEKDEAKDMDETVENEFDIE